MMDSFIFYRSFAEALRNLDDDDRLAAYDAIVNYALDLEEPKGKGVAGAILMMARPLLDRNKTLRENGKKGGRPKQAETKENQMETKEEAEENQTETKTEPKSKIINHKSEIINNRYIGGADKSGPVSGDKSRTVYPYREVVDYLNEKAGTAFRADSKDTRRLIKARIDGGFTVDDFRKVIDKKVAQWKADPKMSGYLRPVTLFGTKFEAYLNERGTGQQRGSFFNFDQREDDLDAEMMSRIKRQDDLDAELLAKIRARREAAG